MHKLDPRLEERGRRGQLDVRAVYYNRTIALDDALLRHGLCQDHALEARKEVRRWTTIVDVPLDSLDRGLKMNWRGRPCILQPESETSTDEAAELSRNAKATQ
jgi:hypothetical protein